jgi:hypothetical protein
MGLRGQLHVPVSLLSGKTPYPLDGRLGEPQGRSGRARNISPLLEFNPRTDQSVACRSVRSDWWGRKSVVLKNVNTEL